MNISSPPSAGANPSPSADAHGQAALLMVESLVHGLIAGTVISVREAVDIVEVAHETQAAFIDGAHEPTSNMVQTAALLSAVVASLKVDLRE